MLTELFHHVLQLRFSIVNVGLSTCRVSISHFRKWLMDLQEVYIPSVSFTCLTDGFSSIRNEHWLTTLTDRVDSRDPVGSKNNIYPNTQSFLLFA